jgi:antirestriction protein ArdC
MIRDHRGAWYPMTLLASWLVALKHDPKAIFTSVAQAQAAADWIHAHASASAAALPIAA